jgi:uncharacterized protein (TIRG00374 family)
VLEQLRKRVLIGLALGVLVVGAIIVLADGPELLAALRRFNWWLLPPVLLLVLLNYLLRFFKWQYYLRLSSVHGLTGRESGLIFLSGFSMAMTPGKVGEFLKAYFVRLRTTTPLTRTLPVVAAERVTDAAGILVLAGFGLLAFRFGWPAFVLIALLMATGLVLLQREAFVEWWLAHLGRLHFARRRLDALRSLYQSTRRLLSPRPLLVALGLSTLSWFWEGVAFFLILVGLDIEPSWELLLAAVFVFSASAWLGGLTLLPGGLGATEASAAALLLLTVDDPAMNRTVAAAATLLLRFATLWFGVFIGIVALWVVARWRPVDEPAAALERPEIAAG